MTIGTMLGDVFESIFKKPATQRYPFERFPAPARYRGKLHWNPEKCSGCQLCVKDCPSYALELITVDKATKRFVMRFHSSRCTYCSQCVVSCRFGCLYQSNDEWELAASSRDTFELMYGRDEDVREYLARSVAPPATE
jgi:NAD(P)H-quinone oxidoreductase subunit I